MTDQTYRPEGHTREDEERWADLNMSEARRLSQPGDPALRTAICTSCGATEREGLLDEAGRCEQCQPPLEAALFESAGERYEGGDR